MHGCTCADGAGSTHAQHASGQGGSREPGQAALTRQLLGSQPTQPVAYGAYAICICLMYSYTNRTQLALLLLPPPWQSL